MEETNFNDDEGEGLPPTRRRHGGPLPSHTRSFGLHAQMQPHTRQKEEKEEDRKLNESPITIRETHIEREKNNADQRTKQ